MKKIGVISTIFGLIFCIYLLVQGILSSKIYTTQIGNYWTLADRASTIEQKSDYMNKFVQALENAKVSEYDAVLIKTPENSFSENLKALKSLQSRLEEIKTLDPNSFVYQTAIEQITAQEQGQAQEMLHVFVGCWYLQNYILLWNWISAIIFITGLSLFIGGIFLIYASYS